MSDKPLFVQDRIITRIGNSLGVTLPPGYVEKGEVVRVEIYDDHIYIHRYKRKIEEIKTVVRE